MNTIEQIKTSTDRLVRIRPAYREILSFYGKVFEVQEKSMQKIELEPIQIDPELLKLKKENQMPLIDPSQFSIDDKEATRAFKEICTIAETHAPNLASDAAKSAQALEDKLFEPEKVFADILENNTGFLEKLSGKLDVDPGKFRLLGYLSLGPSLFTCARQLAAYLNEDLVYNQGYCPICGDKPDLAILDEIGRKHLKCCRCRHQWHVKRMGCVFCGSSDSKKQQYFFSSEEKEYRVNLCDDCGNYIKVVDLRQINRFFYPGLEAVSTLHLDFKAKEKGYSSLVGI